MTLPNTPKRHSSKRVWLAPLLYLLAGGALLGLSTNLAKLAGEMQLSALAFLYWSILGAALILLTLAAYRRNLRAPTCSSFRLSPM